MRRSSSEDAISNCIFDEFEDDWKAMARKSSSYHYPGGLERAIIDLIHVGSSGDAAGVQQVASRLLRDVPAQIENAENFREMIAEALRAAVVPSGTRSLRGEVPVDSESRLPLLGIDVNAVTDELVFSREVETALNEVVDERAQLAAFEEAGVSITRKVLFVGPPGVGKTSAASWLAAKTGLPLFSLDLSSVVSSYLGKSGRNIKAVLDYAKSRSCVFLLDEFDALAKRRDDPSDLGELRRLVNVILVELDKWPDNAILVAATNHAGLLDPALERRFDRIIEFGLPSQIERERILGSLNTRHLLPPIFLPILARFSQGMSGSDLTRLWNAAQRRQLLYGGSFEIEVLGELLKVPLLSKATKERLWRLLYEDFDISARRLAELSGTSHPTIMASIRRMQEHDRRSCSSAT